MLHYLLTGLTPSLSPFRFSPMSSAAIPAELGSLIAQMVEMDMEKRPASMSEVKQELYDIVAQLNESQHAPTQYVGGSSLPPTQLAAPASPPPPPAAPVQSVPPSPSQGTVLCTYRGHSDGILGLAWSPDGTRIASASSDDSALQVWDATTGQTLYTYRGHAEGSVITLAWSPDGKYIASGSIGEKTVQIWDATTGKPFFTYSGHADPVWALAWSPDGSRIASGSNDKTVQVWQAG